MTKDEVIELAKEADVWVAGQEPYQSQLEAFAKLVAAKEREACAKVCESLSLEWEEQPDIAQVELATMLDCALAIRARGCA